MLCESGHPEVFKIPGFRVALPPEADQPKAEAIASLPVNCSTDFANTTLVGLLDQGFVSTPRAQSSEKTNWPHPNFWQRVSATELRSQNLLLGLYGFPY